MKSKEFFFDFVKNQFFLIFCITPNKFLYKLDFYQTRKPAFPRLIPYMYIIYFKWCYANISIHFYLKERGEGILARTIILVMDEVYEYGSM